MKSEIEQPWIEAGYEIFSKEGPAGLKVDQLARKVGISRSSFYHLFADLDVFQEKLLMYHAQRAQRAAEKVKTCKTLDPDFILLIVDEADYVLFNRQLRIYRDNAAYKVGFENAIALVGKETIPLFAQMVEIEHKPDLSKSYFKMTADVLFHRMTPENMNFEWLQGFMKEIKQFVKQIDEVPKSKPE